ncbi:hypothetical protein ACFE04_028910 [Oxalis oulophora]
MASTTTAVVWSPSSPQLRLTITTTSSCRKQSPPALVVRRSTRFNNHHHHTLSSSHHRIPRVHYDVSNVNYLSIRRGSSWWIRATKVDAYSGWSASDNNNDEGLPETDNKTNNWFTAGSVQVGVAGIALLLGLTFAASSLTKRITRGYKPELKPLTTEQEELLVADDDGKKVEEEDVVDTGNGVEKNDSGLQEETGTDNILSSSSVIDEDASENKLSNDNEPSSSDHNTNIISDDDPASHNMSIAPHLTSGSPKLEDPETIDGSPKTEDSVGESESLVEPISESDENSVTIEPNYSLSQTNLETDLVDDPDVSLDSSSGPTINEPSESINVSIFSNSQLDIVPEPSIVAEEHIEISATKIFEQNKTEVVLADEMHSVDEKGSVEKTSSAFSYRFGTVQDSNDGNRGESPVESPSDVPIGIPAPSVLSAALQVPPGKVLVPAVVDQLQEQALAALQVLKVIEPDLQPSELCTRREYARWLVSASNSLSRNTMSKVYPAMYIENVTELAFDDITPEDPDFSSIQGLAEAGLISSKLSNRDLYNEEQGPSFFSPESLLSRQDLVSWKMALEKRQLPKADKKILYELSGFIDIDKINKDAWPALVADLSAGEQGIVALSFGCTRLFQPNKPVTKAQAAVALATGEASDIVSEELARIEAESMAEKAVSVHSALVAEVEKDVNANFENELLMEREKINAVEKMAEEAKLELERLRAQREEDNLTLMKERAAIESEMEVLSRLRREVEEQLESLMTNKAHVAYEKEKINKLRLEAETENQAIGRLQYELEVERKALSMARAWAEDEAKRAREQVKALEEARDRWEKHGIKVVVGDDLRDETAAALLNTGNQFAVEGTVSRAQTLVDQLKIMADDVKGKSKETINIIIQKILFVISILKEWIAKTVSKTGELKNNAAAKFKESTEELQQSTSQFTSTVMEGTKRLAGDCREGVGKLTQKFKA